jgi:integrase/recombinase XerD
MKDNMMFYRMLRDFFLDYLITQRNSSSKTISAYKTSLNQFRLYLRDEKSITFEKVDFDCFSKVQVYGFLVYLRDNRKCSVATLNLRLAAIKSFLRYCSGEDISCTAVYLGVSGIHKFKGEKKPCVEYLKPEQLKLIYSVPENQTKMGRRDIFIMIFFYETGARIEELLNLKLSDIMRIGKVSQIRIYGKGKKVRHVPLLNETLLHLDAYLSEFHPSSGDNDYLFYTIHNHVHTKMSPGNVDHLLKKYASKASVSDDTFPKKLHAHMFRHSIAMAMYKKGVPLSYIKDILGHESFDSVTIYAYADGETITEALLKIEHEPASQKKKWKTHEKELLAFCGLE